MCLNKPLILSPTSSIPGIVLAVTALLFSTVATELHASTFVDDPDWALVLTGATGPVCKGEEVSFTATLTCKDPDTGMFVTPDPPASVTIDVSGAANGSMTADNAVTIGPLTVTGTGTITVCASGGGDERVMTLDAFEVVFSGLSDLPVGWCVYSQMTTVPAGFEDVPSIVVSGAASKSADNGGTPAPRVFLISGDSLGSADIKAVNNGFECTVASITVTDPATTPPPTTPACISSSGGAQIGAPYCHDCGCTGGGPPSCGPPVGSGLMVLFHNGEEAYTKTDLRIPGRGIDWTHTRVYRSQRRIDTAMGFGWTHSLFDMLFVFDDGTVRAYGGIAPFDTTRHDDYLPDPSTPNRYIAPRGIFSRLIRDDNGTPTDTTDDRYTLIDRDASQREYIAVSADFAVLATIRDRYDNRIELYYEDSTIPTLVTRVNDTLGRDIHYAYYPGDDPNPGRRNRLATITDFAGRVLRYDYDSNGNLIEAISPSVTGTVTGNNFPNGKKERYTYSSGFVDNDLNHNLLSVIRPNENDASHGLPADGTPALQWQYDTNDRVIAHTVGALSGAGAAGGTITYDYDDTPTPPSDFEPTMESIATFKITETDRNGNVRVYWMDAFGVLTRFEHFTNGIRPGEPPKYLRRYALNNDNLNSQVEEPEGNRWEANFDTTNPDRRQQGNMLGAAHKPDSRGGDQPQLEWRYVYDPLYNQPCLIIDPRAFAPAFVPPNGGVPSAQRYATIYMFDYQEGPNTDAHKQRLADKFGFTLQELKDIIEFNEAQVEKALGLPAGSVTLLGKGDLNGDGRTDMINGNHVQVIKPAVELVPGSNQALANGGTTQNVIHTYAYDDHGLKLYAIDPVGNVTDYAYFSAVDPNGDGDSSEVADPQSGNGYLRSTLQDDRELPAVTPRVATADGIGFASLLTTLTRDVVGNRTAMTDPRGNTWTYVVNELNQTIRVTEPAPYSHSKDTIFDANNNAIEHRTENQVPLLLDNKPQIDGTGNIILTAGTPTEFIDRVTYDILNNRIEDDRDATGSTPDRLITQYQYDSNENQILVIKPEGNMINTVYDERDLRVTVTTGFASPDASTITYNYDDNQNLVEVVDAQDNNGDAVPESVLTEYDGYDRIKRTIDAVGNVLEFSYDAVNNTIEERRFGVVGGPSPTDNLGTGNVLLSHTRYQYDELNRVYQVDRLLDVAIGTLLNRPAVLVDGPLSVADGFVSQRTEYDAASRVTFTVEDDLDATAMVYDGVDRQVQTVDAGDNTVAYTYDENANVVQMVETDKSQLGTIPDEIIVTKTTYDVLNRPTVVVDNVTNTDRFAYDSRNNQTTHQDAEGNSRHTVYDGANRTIATHTDMRADGTGNTTIDPSQSGDGFISVFTAWDGNSRLSALVDDNGNRTIYGYDELDRKVSCTYGDVVAPALADRQDPTTAESWSYDQDHNVISFTDQNGTVCTYTYDGLNRRVQKDLSFAVGNPHNLTGTTQQTTQYDGLSRKTLCTDNNEPANADDDLQCTYGYDTLSRQLEETQQIGSLPIRVASCEYDESISTAGNLDATACVFPDGRRIENRYDDLNRLNAVADTGFSPIVSYAYIGRNARMLSKTYQNGTTRTVSYDGIRRPLNLTTEDSSSALIVGFEHAYDREDNKRFERKLHDPVNSELYGYDSAYRLNLFVRGTLNGGGTGVSTPTPLAGSLQSRSWQLDGVGNWSQNLTKVEGITTPQERLRDDTNLNEFVAEFAPANSVVNIAVDVLVDTQVEEDNPNTNFGAETELELSNTNRVRSLVRFDETAIDTAIAGRTLESATLKLDIAFADSNWGATGEVIYAHRLTSDWVEGDSTMGDGATWNCAIDDEIRNTIEECLVSWTMDERAGTPPWELEPTGKAVITNNQTGTVSINVTPDVSAIVNGTVTNFGWILLKEVDGTGRIRFLSRESGSAPQLILEVSDSNVTAVGEFEHDDNGNLTEDTTFGYQWDAVNRLRTVRRKADNAIIAEYTYDCDNRRMRKSVSNSGTLNGITDYYYKHWRVCEEHSFDGATESLTRHYIWGALYHDELVSRDDRAGVSIAQLNDGAGSQRHFQHSNTLFSIVAITSENGSIIERYQYDPYGTATVMDANLNPIPASTVGNEFTYTGQRIDRETDLYYCKNRYYNSEQGRFISRDLIGYDPFGYDDASNPYAGHFAMEMGVDPFGLFTSTYVHPSPSLGITVTSPMMHTNLTPYIPQSCCCNSPITSSTILAKLTFSLTASGDDAYGAATVGSKHACTKWVRWQWYTCNRMDGLLYRKGFKGGLNGGFSYDTVWTAFIFNGMVNVTSVTEYCDPVTKMTKRVATNHGIGLSGGTPPTWGKSSPYVSSITP